MLDDALIYLAATVVCVPIAWRLKLSAVLGYLIAGALIGPWGLKLVSDVEAIMHFFGFGVVLMLFAIGLELEPKRLVEMRRSVFGGGALQLVLSGVALMLGAVVAGLDWKASLVVGLALALSSTAIAIGTVTERSLLSTPAFIAGVLVASFEYRHALETDIDPSKGLLLGLFFISVGKNFPKLGMIARARNVTHYVELRSRGVDVIERETFEAALRAGRHALEALGFDRFRARDVASIFRRHNVRNLDARVSLFKDEVSRVSASTAGRDELAALFARDREQFESGQSSADWH